MNSFHSPSSSSTSSFFRGRTSIVPIVKSLVIQVLPAGIKVEEEDKWLTLIQNAGKERKQGR
jgi:hypothetical protein